MTANRAVTSSKGREGFVEDDGPRREMACPLDDRKRTICNALNASASTAAHFFALARLFLQLDYIMMR